EILRAEHAAGKIKTFRIAATRILFNFRTARITEPEHFGYFVECLTSSIVNGVADDLIIRQATNHDQHRVSAAHDERHIWLDVVVAIVLDAKKWREQMSLEMIDTQVPSAEADCQSLRNRRTDH